ncbi:MAG: hypothetical protein GY869_08250 [Planctomycetes bacterium]|nr:hypothetical protein [Planctomycetota bacterium]
MVYETGRETAELSNIIRAKEYAIRTSMPAALTANSVRIRFAESKMPEAKRARFEKSVVSLMDNLLGFALARLFSLTNKTGVRSDRSQSPMDLWSDV